MKLEIGNFILRTWENNDSNALAKYANNPKIAANVRDAFPHPYTRADAETFIGSLIDKTPPTTFAISNEHEAIGGIGLNIGQDVNRLTAELGYWLAEPFWSQGITTAAACAITNYGFDELELLRIYAVPFATNTASIRVLEKAGFEYEGRLRANAIKYEKILDQVVYAKIREGII